MRLRPRVPNTNENLLRLVSTEFGGSNDKPTVAAQTDEVLATSEDATRSSGTGQNKSPGPSACCKGDDADGCCKSNEAASASAGCCGGACSSTNASAQKSAGEKRGVADVAVRIL